MKKNRTKQIFSSLSKKTRPLFNYSFLFIIVMAFIFALGYLWSAARGANFFNIKDIIVDSREELDFSHLQGLNIFTVDLKRESGDLQQDYPNFKSVRFIRVLPDRLYVDFVRRSPVALVRLYRCFCVDYNKTLFDCPGECQKNELPVIYGLETRIFGPKTGRVYEVKELAVALELIRELRENRMTKNYGIKSINVSSLAHIVIIITRYEKIPFYNRQEASLTEATDIEVRLDPERIDEKVNILASLLNQARNKAQELEYIDLRFKEPVIKIKQEK